MALVNENKTITTGEESPVMNTHQGNNYYKSSVVNLESMPIIIIDPNEMSALISIFYSEIWDIVKNINNTTQLKRTSHKRKNEINGMSEVYFKNAIKKYIPYFGELDKFLSDINNEEEKIRYKYVADDVNKKIIAHRKRFTSFDEAFESIMSEFITGIDKKNHLSIDKKQLVKVFFAYTYFNCDVGENDED